MTRANIPDLVKWLTVFQPELQDDIDNGARIDCTRKPGFYVRQYKTWRQATYGDWMLVDIENDRVLTAEKYLEEVLEDNSVERMAELIYHATNCVNGLALDCTEPHGEHYCECDTPEFSDKYDVIDLHENQSEEFDHLYKQIIVDNNEEFYKWVGNNDAQHVAEKLDYTWETASLFKTSGSAYRIFCGTCYPRKEKK